MIDILGKIPRKVGIALSGGLDSIAIYDFLTRDGKREVVPIYFNHGTEHGKHARDFVTNHVNRHLERTKPGKTAHHVVSNYAPDNNHKRASESQEEYWRRIRYGFLDKVAEGDDIDVITCHHLDDQVETWLFSALHGTPKLIPYRRNRIIRPFLTTKKSELEGWCKRHDLEWIDDPSNKDTRFMRNFIRLDLMLKAKHVNPGIQKTIKKRVLKEFQLKHALKV